MTDYQFKLLDSLEKIFPSQPPTSPSNPLTISGLWGETISFQLAYQMDYEGIDVLDQAIRLEVNGTLADQLTCRYVGLVPSTLPAYGDYDDNYLTIDPGLFPDPLYPTKPNIDQSQTDTGKYHMLLKPIPRQWRGLWFDLKLNPEQPAGKYQLTLSISSSEQHLLWSDALEIEIIGACLPQQQLIHTEWFHADCLANYYQVPVFSEDHWTAIDHFIKTAAEHGINMLLTPIFTPPLDTLVGGERTTVQLIDCNKSGDQFHFSLDKLDRWIDLALSHSIEYFEISHLFTQWGAKYTPKILVTENGIQQQMFGWHVKSTAPEYQSFLTQLIPVLDQYFIQKGIKDRVFFHISDEPHEQDHQTYATAKQIVAPLLSDYPVVDALSTYQLYAQGVVEKPIVSNDKIEPFLAHQVPNLWTYYCCAQHLKVSNRFMSMPSARNRILGLQLYKYDITGFLHWGYNFYNSQYSLEAINPFAVTDAKEAFPSGDPFLVYPGAEFRPIESIRLMVLSQAIYDLRALRLLESMIGRSEVIKLIDQQAGQPLTFDCYPPEKEYLFHLRQTVHQLIKQHLQ